MVTPDGFRPLHRGEIVDKGDYVWCLGIYRPAHQYIGHVVVNDDNFIRRFRSGYRPIEGGWKQLGE